MNIRCIFCLLSCLIGLCHCDLSLQWHGKQPMSNIFTELSVTGKDLKECEQQRNLCVSDSNDCSSVPTIRKDFVFNRTCRYLEHEKSFRCKWISVNDVKRNMTNSFIFSQSMDFSHCPSIFNLLSNFNLTIKSKDPLNKIEIYSHIYAVSIENIVQAPRPYIISVNATETSLNVTWMSQGHKNCLVRYKQSNSEENEQWKEEEDSELFHVIRGLQPFSQYIITVACIKEYGLISEWSPTFQAKTLEGAPIAPLDVSYCVESLNNNFRLQRLLVIWRPLTIAEARGDILGYSLTYTSAEQPSPKGNNTHHLTAEFEVDPGVYNLTLIAYNSAGSSPAHNFRVNTVTYRSLPGVKGLWANTETDSLRFQWEVEENTVKVSEFAIEWFAIDDASPRLWKRVNGSTFSTVLKGIIKQFNYSMSVYPLYERFCGHPGSIQANLESGTLLDIDQLQLVNVTKTSVTVQWVWQRKLPSTNVLRYTLALLGANITRSLKIFPHQYQHSFHNLQRNVKYSVYIYGETISGNFPKENLEFTTLFLENDEIIKVVIFLVLLVIGLGTFSVFSRTIYDYFFPNIANPGHSLIGHWLQNPFHESLHVISVLKLEDFSLNNQHTEKPIRQMEHQMFSEKDDVEEEEMYLSDICDTCDYPVETSDGVKNSQASPSLADYVDMPLLPDNFGYVENCPTLSNDT
ncbi:interleukin-31 receptor subunit alpha isoform X1 [Hoplias malabaricus]|uniref:interleukin-31 receptor subunit alpha isoform X1 n=1 Tax=Hoplias malabaricus TaxID=27720 RepID=UPI003461F0B6